MGEQKRRHELGDAPNLKARRAHKARVKRFMEYLNMARAGVPVLHMASWMNFRIMVAR